MRSNRPSRWLAPIALLAAVAAVYIVISGSTSNSDGGGSGSQSEERASTTGTDGERDETRTTRTSTTSKRKTYRVRPGDTLALISERTGVTVEELQELNPDLDPNSLSVGEKIKLSE